MFDRNLETTVDILAPAEVVWAVLTDTAAWPEWNPILKCEGRFEQGQRLEVTAHLPGRSPQTFKPTVLTGECTEGRRGWRMLPGTADEARMHSILQVPRPSINANGAPPCPAAQPSSFNCRATQQPLGPPFIETPPAAPSRCHAAVEPNAELAWRGSAAIPGLFAGRHYFRLEPEGAGACRLVHGEDFSGLLVPFFGGILADTEKGFHAMNAALKARAEARAGGAQE